MYVLDTNVISNLHKNYYRKRFVSLWKAFDQLVADDKITSTREVYQELHRGWAGRGWAGADTEWAKVNKNLFASLMRRSAPSSRRYIRWSTSRPTLRGRNSTMAA